MMTAATQSLWWRMVPLMSAVGYASVVFATWGGGHGRDIALLGLGYAATIIACGIFAASIAILYCVLTSISRDEDCSPLVPVRQFVADRWRVNRGASMWQPLLTFVILMTAFTFFKQVALPHAGFGYGPIFAAADRALFGVDPWRITHAALASPWWSQLIDFAYHGWFAPMAFGVILCALARPDSVLAWRYMVAFCLTWIVQGTILAYSFPAAGPVFFAHIQQETARFTELTDLLSAQDAALRAQGAPGLSALLFQHHLLQIFQDKGVAVGGGISAMPSLHNALAILFAFASWRVSPRWGRVMTGYAVLIWIGSIHLGWHYAIDGIVALIATSALWKLTGLLDHMARRAPTLSWRIPLPAMVVPAVIRSAARRTDERRHDSSGQ